MTTHNLTDMYPVAIEGIEKSVSLNLQKLSDCSAIFPAYGYKWKRPKPK